MFRPTFLDVFNLSNLELGTLFSTYGSVAFLSYIFGGVLADKFSPRKLLSYSLIFTSLGGFFMMSYPTYFLLQLLYAYWGFTTVFLFWAPMIKATSIIGGLKKQGKTFSFLDAGRGIVASSIGIIGVLIFSFVVVGDISDSSIEEKQDAFRYVIGASSLIVFITGVIVYIFLKVEIKDVAMIGDFGDMKRLIKSKSLILIGLIILTAYKAHKVLNFKSQLYAPDLIDHNDLRHCKQQISC